MENSPVGSPEGQGCVAGGTGGAGAGADGGEIGEGGAFLRTLAGEDGSIGCNHVPFQSHRPRRRLDHTTQHRSVQGHVRGGQERICTGLRSHPGHRSRRGREKVAHRSRIDQENVAKVKRRSGEGR